MVDNEQPPSSRDGSQSEQSEQSAFSTGFSVDDDAGSVIGDDAGASSTQSLRSSIYEYVEEHGRTFHKYKQGRYWMPNDPLEQDRLDLQHAVFTMRLGGELGLAPPVATADGVGPRSVLDLGTGTGIWAIDCAQKYPSSSVLGTDLSPIQPAFIPANCRFEVDDAEDEWVYSRGGEGSGSSPAFDYVHLRMMFHCFRDHRAVMRSALEHLRPGGYMEWQDWSPVLRCDDGTMSGTALERWSRLFVDAGSRLGRDMHSPQRYRRWMAEVGFVDIVERRLPVPGNPWAKGRENKRMGFLQMTNFVEGLHAATMTLFTRGLGMTTAEVEELIEECKAAVKNTRIHFYWLTYVVYGRKPLS